MRLLLAWLLIVSNIQGGRLFDGVDDIATAASTPNLNTLGTLTICAWILPLGGGETAGRVYQKGPATANTSFFVTSANRLGVTRTTSAVGVSSQSQDAYVPFSSWSFVCTSWTSGAGGARLYRGVAGGTVTEASSYAIRDSETGTLSSDNAEGLYIGNRLDTARTFQGTIAEVRVYNVVLSLTEMSTLLKGWPVRAGSGLLAYYSLYAAVTGTEPDGGPSGYTLTVTGATRSTNHAPISPSFGWWLRSAAEFLHLSTPWIAS